MKEILLYGDDSEILSIKLEDILQCVDCSRPIFWGLLWLDITTRPDVAISAIELENKVNSTDVVIDFSLDCLFDLAAKIDQAINMLIIGDVDASNIRKYSNDRMMYEHCEYVIELVDSSFWAISSKNNSFVISLKENLKGKIIDS